MVPNAHSQISALVNPAAGSGRGARVLPLVKAALKASFPAAEIQVIATQSREHIFELGRSVKADLLLCVGGDGSVHDLAQTLISRPASQRPALAFIPVGSGNDYARTLGMPLEPLAALHALRDCQLVQVDVGKVNDRYFLETLSFGADAAVALKTEEMRLTSKERGTRLYTRAAINTIIHDLVQHKAHCRIGEQSFECEFLIFAVQNGPTYGSG
ncbi:MAG: hypothetical protein LBP28_03250, partial [Coriobacteriales bacterium]|nr:hypothetical protein [Coriobacteriales bacterium]